MKNSMKNHIDNLINFLDINKSSSIIEVYTIYSIKKYIDNDIDKYWISYFLGNLLFLYSKKEIDKSRIKDFVNKISNMFPYSNYNLINSISNFMEMVIIYNPEETKHYIYKLNRIDNLMEEDYSAVLYKALALPCYKGIIKLEDIEDKLTYSWRFYEELYNLNYSYRKYDMCLKFIKKCIEKSPEKLEKGYKILEKKLYKILNENKGVIFIDDYTGF